MTALNGRGTGLQALYHEVILDHAKHPRGAGLREPYDGASHQVNPTCGDEITLRVALHGGRVADVSYDATGCAISQAAASVLADLVTGEPRDVAERIAAAFDAMVTSRGTDAGDAELLGDAVAFAGVAQFPQRVKCALLPWMAWRAACVVADETAAGAPHAETETTFTSHRAPTGTESRDD